MPDKLEYMSGELVDLSGATIELTFSDGKTEEIDITKEQLIYAGYGSGGYNIDDKYTISCEWKNGVKDCLQRDAKGKYSLDLKN